MLKAYLGTCEKFMAKSFYGNSWLFLKTSSAIDVSQGAKYASVNVYSHAQDIWDKP